MTTSTVSVGHSSGFLTVSNGETLDVDGVTSFTSVHSGGLEQVFGTVSATTVSNGGKEFISSGGTASATTVQNGGTQEVFSNGVAISTTISNGGRASVLNGGTTSFTTVSRGGNQYVSSGGTASNTIVTNRGTQDVFSSGFAFSTTVSNSGWENVEAGGSATSTTVDSGGYQQALGITNFTTLSHGIQFVSAGGHASNTIIDNGGVQDVYSGSLAVSTMVEENGTLDVFNHASANFTSVNAEGNEVVSGTGATADDSTVSGFLGLSAGGTATSTTVSGGEDGVYGGGIAISTTLVNGGEELVYGGTASFTTVSSGTQTVSSGGTTSKTTISNGGTENVAGNGSANSTTVDSGGSEFVYGGEADFTTVNGGGSELAYNGGDVAGTTVNSGGVESVGFDGTAAATTIEGGGVEFVYSGGETVSTTINSGAIELVFPGATAEDTTLSTGGDLVILPGGNAIGTKLSGGTSVTTGVLVYRPGSGLAISGNTASDIVVNNGGTVYVLTGGTATSTTVNSGGVAAVYSGGALSDTTLDQNATDYVYSSGTAISTTVAGAASENVSSGGATSFSTVSSGGNQYVDRGGTTSFTTLSGGTETIAASATASATTVDKGGREYVSSGGTAISTTIGGSGTEYVYSAGVTSFTTVDSGGFEDVLRRGTVSLTTVSAGGIEDLTQAAEADNTTLDSGGTEYVYSQAEAVSATVDNGGAQFLYSGGQSVSTTVNAGGAEIVYATGDAISTTVSTGGFLVALPNATITAPQLAGGEIVSSGVVTDHPGSGVTVAAASAGATTLGSGGLQFVLQGGTANATTVDGGGNLYIYPNGTASSATVSAGGFITVSDGGIAVATTLVNGGREILDAGATAISTTVSAGSFDYVSTALTSFTTVSNGGTEYVAEYGEAISTTVDSGGFQIVSGGYVFMTAYEEYFLVGGTATGTVVNNGGHQAVITGATITGTTVNSGGYEVLSQGTAVSTSVALGGSIDDTELDYAAGGTVSVTSSNVLTATIGTDTYSQQLVGDYTGEYFHLAPGTYGGTAITLEGTACYCRGTLILTDRGEIAVEELRIGDRLMTLSGALRPIRWIGRRSYAGRFAAGNRDVLPVLIRANALADGVPRRDLSISPLHAMYLDGMLIPALALVNGLSIMQREAVEQVEYIHPELDSHDIILAEGAPAETFIDDDSRGMFHNASEYRLLYPNVPRQPAGFCAPRVEDGEQLEAVRRRLAARATPPAADAPAPGRLLGHLDYVGRDAITGWARDEAAPDRPVQLSLLDNDVTIASVVADRYRADLEAAGIGNGCHSFEYSIPGGLSPLLRHLIRVRRAADGQELPRSPWAIPAAPITLAIPATRDASLKGQLDLATRDHIAGWVYTGDAPVALQIIDNGVPIAQVLANRYRDDLAAAGIGNGRCGFDVAIPGGLSPLERHVIQVLREADGAELAGSPTVIEPACGLDAGLRQAIVRAVAAAGSAGEQEHTLGFILEQADKLLQLRADGQARRGERLAYQRFHRRSGRLAAEPAPDPGLRALVIDERLPEPGNDAASHAILSHMRALTRLGYAVSFVAADQITQTPADVATLEAEGITCCGSPFYASAEDVMRRQADCFAVVYLHRASMATRYLALARRYMRQARILYSVADLHHVRLERQAIAEERPELLAASRRQRLEECVAAWSADAVITHSAEEVEVLRRLVPEANVYRVPWQVPERPAPSRKAARHGLAFIGGYAHAPNVDAARWLVEAVMPLVWQADPHIECLLVGSNMPEPVRRLAGPGVVALGHVADLGSVFDRVRLTVAPLRYGAGVKGKVLDSLAAGVPCVMTPIAAEGLSLPAGLHALVGENAADLASAICILHQDDAAWRKAARAGRSLIRRHHNAATVAEALQAAIEGHVLPGQTQTRTGAVA